MKNFKQFNESIRSVLKGKSDDEIVKALKYMIINNKIKYIIKYQLDYNLLPRNKEGICIYDGGNLYCSSSELTSLPDNLTVNGSLICAHNLLTSLPDNLIVNGYLDCCFNELTSLSDNLIVDSDLKCSFNQLTKLPKGLNVGGWLDCRNNPEELELPKDAKIGGKFIN